MNNLELKKKRLDWSSMDDVYGENQNKNEIASLPKSSSPQKASDGENIDSIFNEALMSADESNESLLRAGDMLANITEDASIDDVPEIDPFVTTDEKFDLESENFVVVEDADVEVPPSPPSPPKVEEEAEIKSNAAITQDDAAQISVPGELTGSVVFDAVRVLRPKEDASGNVVGYSAVDSVNDYNNNDNYDEDDEDENEENDSNSKFSLLGWRPFSSKTTRLPLPPLPPKSAREHLVFSNPTAKPAFDQFFALNTPTCASTKEKSLKKRLKPKARASCVSPRAIGTKVDSRKANPTGKVN